MKLWWSRCVGSLSGAKHEIVMLLIKLIISCSSNVSSNALVKGFPQICPLGSAQLTYYYYIQCHIIIKLIICHWSQLISLLKFQGKQLDASLGFAAGVMTAASYWSLLAPCIEMAIESKLYGVDGRYAFIPACVGFLLGAGFTYATDYLISRMGIESPSFLLGNVSRSGN